MAHAAQPSAEHQSAGAFYAQLVSLDPAGPRWGEGGGGAGLGAAGPAPAPAPGRATTRPSAGPYSMATPRSVTAAAALRSKPVAFRSAGVHDLSALQPTQLHPGRSSSTSAAQAAGTGTGTANGSAGAAGPGSHDPQGVAVVIIPPPARPAAAGNGSTGGGAEAGDEEMYVEHRGGRRYATGAGGLSAGLEHVGNSGSGGRLEGGGGLGGSWTGGAGRSHHTSVQDDVGSDPMARAPPRSLKAAEALLDRQWRDASARAVGAEKPKIAADNIGYQLLRAAGWREGTGLGREQQGRTTPLDPSKNPGTHGIGFDAKRQRDPGAPNAVQGRAQQQGRQGEEGAAGQGATRSRVSQIVEAELAAESVEQKVARHKAAMAADEKAARDRAIQRAVYRAFDDPFDNAGYATANTQVIGKRNRLTAYNPLLGSDEDE